MSDQSEGKTVQPGRWPGSSALQNLLPFLRDDYHAGNPDLDRAIDDATAALEAPPVRADPRVRPEPENRARLQLAPTASASGAGKFEILAITAGQANGWTFPADVLQASVPLWDRVECFIDHDELGAGHSVRDLAGIVHSPAWDASHQGVRAQLKTTGPSGAILDQ
ncbi:MAG TPA: hypothetical protein VMB75_04185, partial [Rhodocyclaceae bacterium]|nr:hypothetical protein [Rhodocyclaceae bacterium]